MQNKNFNFNKKEAEEVLRESDSTQFYRDFNISKKAIYERPINFSISDKLSDNERQLIVRKRILESELKDFTKLAGTTETYLKKLDKIHQIVLDRFILEKRNSFSLKLEDTYKNFLYASRDLKNITANQQYKFYRKRINLLKKELESIQKELKNSPPK